MTVKPAWIEPLTCSSEPNLATVSPAQATPGLVAGNSIAWASTQADFAAVYLRRGRCAVVLTDVAPKRALHMVVLNQPKIGKVVRVTAHLPGGGEQSLLRIDDWD